MNATTAITATDWRMRRRMKASTGGESTRAADSNVALASDASTTIMPKGPGSVNGGSGDVSRRPRARMNSRLQDTAALWVRIYSDHASAHPGARMNSRLQDAAALWVRIYSDRASTHPGA